MPTRLEQLQSMLAKEPTDTFLLYGLAMEHKKAGQPAEALALLEKVVSIDPKHGYAFFQRGQIFESTGDLTAAKAAYIAGISAATAGGDSHAVGELQGALSMLD